MFCFFFIPVYPKSNFTLNNFNMDNITELLGGNPSSYEFKADITKAYDSIDYS
tara:strand:- start:993 stop:1151 length:159 start_codon:yes stop_codon:yes gene_type:complete